MKYFEILPDTSEIRTLLSIKVSEISTPSLKRICRWLSTSILMFFSIQYFGLKSEYDIFVFFGVGILYFIAVIPKYDE